jgi:hypothetical protein
VLKILARAIKQGKEMKGIQTGKEEAKLYPYLKDPKDSSENPLDPINTFGKVVQYKIKFKN